MTENLVAEINTRVTALPLAQQREVLKIVEAMLHKNEALVQEEAKRPYRSTRGLFAQSGVKITAEDIAEVRREMWANFPREEPR